MALEVSFSCFSMGGVAAVCLWCISSVGGVVICCWTAGVILWHWPCVTSLPELAGSMLAFEVEGSVIDFLHASSGVGLTVGEDFFQDGNGAWYSE